VSDNLTNAWIRPIGDDEAFEGMLECERRRDYEAAALNCLAAASMTPEGSGEGTDLVRIAQVYATLHQAQTALFIAENRQPVIYR
jgi:hypothetical protein